MIPKLLGQLIEVTERRSGLNYGCGSVRFGHRPVAAGDSIRLCASVSEVAKTDQAVQVVYRCRIDCQGYTAEPLLSAEVIYRYTPVPR